MVGCDCCLKWFHCQCVGLSMEEAKNETVWRCESCVDIEILESIDHGQRTDIQKLTVDEHKLLKNMNMISIYKVTKTVIFYLLNAGVNKMFENLFLILNF